MDDKGKEVREALNGVMSDNTEKDRLTEGFAAHTEEEKLTERFDKAFFDGKFKHNITVNFQGLNNDKDRRHFVRIKPEAFIALVDEFIKKKSSISVKQLKQIKEALEAIHSTP